MNSFHVLFIRLFEYLDDPEFIKNLELKPQVREIIHSNEHQIRMVLEDSNDNRYFMDITKIPEEHLKKNRRKTNDNK